MDYNYLSSAARLGTKEEREFVQVDRLWQEELKGKMNDRR